MKKLFACALLLGLSMPCMATEVTTMRIFKEMNDTCIGTITTNNSHTDVLQCALKVVQDPEYWLPGWSTPTKCNVGAIFAGNGAETPEYMSYDQEKILKPILQRQMYASFYTAIQKFKEVGGDKIKLTPQEVSAWRK